MTVRGLEMYISPWDGGSMLVPYMAADTTTIVQMYDVVYVQP